MRRLRARAADSSSRLRVYNTGIGGGRGEMEFENWFFVTYVKLERVIVCIYV